MSLEKDNYVRNNKDNNKTKSKATRAEAEWWTATEMKLRGLNKNVQESSEMQSLFRKKSVGSQYLNEV